MGENLDGFAAEQQRRNAASAMRGHHNEVAPLGVRGVDDGAIGLVVDFADRVTRHAGRVGRHLDLLQRPLGNAPRLFFIFVLAGRDQDASIEAIR